MREIRITVYFRQEDAKARPIRNFKISLFALHLSFPVPLESNFPVPIHRVELARLDSPKHALASGQSDEFENATGR